MLKYISTITFAISLLACGNSGGPASETQNNTTQQTEKQADENTRNTPVFNEQNAYNHIAKQLSFGPRIPNTQAQLDCANWMQSLLKEYCDTVYKQETTVIGGDKSNLRCINLIGVFNPKATKRIIFLAHWDTRPWADRDQLKKNEPILGADDGASGVGVLLELARVLKEYKLNNPDIGVDIFFTDVEDYGKSEWGEDSYCLGTQYWAKNPHIPGYTAEAGILLDMVGAANARFPIEYYSQMYANKVLAEVWQAGENAGYGNYFVYENGGGITDDHIPMNKIAKIPTIDIINLPKGSNTGFVPHWHTHQDNIDVIDPATLKAVGQTLVQYIYNK